MIVMSGKEVLMVTYLYHCVQDLQLCTDMATGVDSLGQFQFGDMVQIGEAIEYLRTVMDISSLYFCIFI
jgi:hypothetical protein